MRSAITPRQNEMFTFLKSYIAAHGISPTFAECQEALGMKSKNQVTKTLVGLEQRQYIRRFKFLNSGLSRLRIENAITQIAIDKLHRRIQ